MTANLLLAIVALPVHQEGERLLSLTDSWEAKESLPQSWPWASLRYLQESPRDLEHTAPREVIQRAGTRWKAKDRVSIVHILTASLQRAVAIQNYV